VEIFYSIGQATDDILRHIFCCVTKAVDMQTRLSVTFYVGFLFCFYLLPDIPCYIFVPKKRLENEVTMTVK
jgi:hypothetical protein